MRAFLGTVTGRQAALVPLGLALALGAPSASSAQPAGQAQSTYDFNDSHFHLTNYVQEGTDVSRFLEIMGTRVGRSTLFGIPLQQTWSYENSGDFAPTYYLHTDAPLYYYSFTDAWIAMAYKSLPAAQQARLDPMITGFNPADMYAVDHIRRVLQTFPGVFSGLGEFTIHKEFVSSKVAGDVASLSDPALDRILDFAGQAGLAVILHNDIDMPFAKEGGEPVYFKQMRELLLRHPQTTIIWAHLGVGRVVHPVANHLRIVEGLLADPKLPNLYFDISWDQVAKYVVESDESVHRVAAFIERYPERFLFGSDEVAPREAQPYFKVYELYAPLWKLLRPETSAKVRRSNYERVFDEARRRVRAWEKENVK